MDCPRCGSLRHVKSGKIQGVQRHHCKDCGRNYTVAKKLTERSQDTKRQALQMYLEGFGFRSIGRILNVSHVSVYHWIRKFGAQIETVRNDKPVEMMELDELHTYVGHKKTTVGFGLVLVETTESTLISRSVIEAPKQD
jgi:transposase-like protein